MIEEKVQVLNTMVHHRIEVQAALQVLIHALQRRALVHDVSKFQEDEFAGFARINRIAREYPYGSEEYRQSLKSEKPTIALHYARNSHHPEGYENAAQDMGLLDLMEMVCDWYGAWKVYDGQREPAQRSSWRENVEKQRARFRDSGPLSAEQWFVVEEVARLLECGP
jgi:hypothetical protein